MLFYMILYNLKACENSEDSRLQLVNRVTQTATKKNWTSLSVIVRPVLKTLKVRKRMMAYILTSFRIDFYMGQQKSKINPSQLNLKPDICDFVADSMHSISLNDVNSKVYTARPTESLCLMIIDMMHFKINLSLEIRKTINCYLVFVDHM